ncbi:MAG TPA: YsnF/AvaK domain-containing protein [Longimicrobiales bacterium]|nr:YsnF/AvaK domain-containing protein [Longimicrobiales bacterium]
MQYQKGLMMNSSGHIHPDSAAVERAEHAAPAALRAPEEQVVIPVVQEELDVRARRVETDAGVRVKKTTEEHEELVDEALIREEVDVERVTVNRAVDAPVAVRYEGDTMIVPVLEETLVIEKRLILREEIRITRRKAQFRDPQTVVLRREHVTIERIEDHEPRVVPTDINAPGPGRESPESLLDEKRRQTEAVRQTLR